MKKYIVQVHEDRTEWKNETGQLHREDGPAVESVNGTKSWWIDGKLHREDGPAVEYNDGTKSWWVEGKLHRLNGPAVELPDGTKSWYVEGKRHRVDGPAIEYSDGFKSWWVDDKELTKTKFDEHMKKSKEMYEWVSVEDELPVFSNYVFLKVENFGEHRGFYANGQWRKDYISVYDKKVTHWLKKVK